MSTPILHIFAISDYCEKARWALDHLDIDHQINFLWPGMHLHVAQKLGTPGSSLPILVANDEVIQGSADIIDWAQKNTATQRCLTPIDGEEQCREFEQRLDNVAGVATRRYFYSEALVEHPNTVRKIFSNDLSPTQKQSVTRDWPTIRELMIQIMDLGAAQGEESKLVVDRELSWIDELLADGRTYLVANQFSRVDIAAASFFAQLAEPAEHPASRFMELPPKMMATQKSWHDRPSLQWNRGIYQKHRNTL